ncbi:hypothetical protein HBI49_016670 [Parastagonospora nodorum]|nr:hypothetical protein HBH51_221420 [Parastagonospora nodorum]KAH4057200.1 hypothetical protein HBH49_043090 [Parastagonospora nodorum]KAH4110287.1 hypothetical protein HBH46_017970 [Parastagonospora nodorum]KAH5203331.1 hypothetical protein HBH68_108060 [Parastagonospora nodorum]KAH5281603.1 hypothetical protein HBI71_005160 [Parastagonospora nodorum]
MSHVSNTCAKKTLPINVQHLLTVPYTMISISPQYREARFRVKSRLDSNIIVIPPQSPICKGHALDIGVISSNHFGGLYCP